MLAHRNLLKEKKIERLASLRLRLLSAGKHRASVSPALKRVAPAHCASVLEA